MATQQPAYRAFTVVKREGQDDFWLAIGAAFPHQSGDGYNVVLQALPIPDREGQCKIVLRPPKETDKEADDEQTKQAVRNANDRRRGRSCHISAVCRAWTDTAVGNTDGSLFYKRLNHHSAYENFLSGIDAISTFIRYLPAEPFPHSTTLARSN